MTKKKAASDQPPEKAGRPNLEAFMNMINEVGQEALARTAQEHAAQPPAPGNGQKVPTFSQDDLDRMVMATNDHFVWFRDSEKFTAKDFIEQQIYEDFEDEIEPDRLAAFQRKKLPTPDELSHFQQRWRQRILDDGGEGIDHDVIPMCSAATHTLPNGQVQHIMICSKGYSFTGVRQWVEGVFDTEDKLWAYANAAWTKP